MAGKFGDEGEVVGEHGGIVTINLSGLVRAPDALLGKTKWLTLRGIERGFESKG